MCVKCFYIVVEFIQCVLRYLHLPLFLKLETNFTATRFMLKTFEWISWYEQIYMPTSSATSLIVIRRSFITILLFTFSHFSTYLTVFDVSQLSWKSLYHSWTHILLKADSHFVMCVYQHNKIFFAMRLSKIAIFKNSRCIMNTPRIHT